MPVDKFGRSPKTTSQNVTNVSGVSHEYLNNNFLRKGQAIDMSGQNILNLGSPRDPMDAVRKKYVNEKFFKRNDPIDMQNKLVKNLLPPIDEGDAANKSYVDSKSVGGSDLNMSGHFQLAHFNLIPRSAQKGTARGVHQSTGSNGGSTFRLNIKFYLFKNVKIIVKS